MGVNRRLTISRLFAITAICALVACFFAHYFRSELTSFEHEGFQLQSEEFVFPGPIVFSIPDAGTALYPIVSCPPAGMETQIPFVIVLLHGNKLKVDTEF